MNNDQSSATADSTLLVVVCFMLAYAVSGRRVVLITWKSSRHYTHFICVHISAGVHPSKTMIDVRPLRCTHIVL